MFKNPTKLATKSLSLKYFNNGRLPFDTVFHHKHCLNILTFEMHQFLFKFCEFQMLSFKVSKNKKLNVQMTSSPKTLMLGPMQEGKGIILPMAL